MSYIRLSIFCLNEFEYNKQKNYDNDNKFIWTILLKKHIKYANLSV